LKVLLKIEDFSTESKNKIIEDKATFLKEKGIHNYQMHNSYVSLIEKISILEELHNSFESIYDMTEVLENMFSDDKEEELSNYVVLSTIHKAKGGERDNVFFLYSSLIPSQYAKTQLELFQERCLLYVCVTRAKKKLIYVNSLPNSINKVLE
jgi:superfamily I DNA/RNA helicase